MKLSDEELVDSLINSYKHESSPYFSNDCKERSDLLALLKRGREAIELVENTIPVLQDAQETIEYVKQYVEKRGLSAEDDCNNSIKLIDDLIQEYEKVKK